MLECVYQASDTDQIRDKSNGTGVSRSTALRARPLHEPTEHAEGAERVLTVLDDPSLVAPSLCSIDRLHTKFAWLREYREDIEVWSSWLALTDATLDIVRRNGYCTSTADDVKRVLTEISHTHETELLKQELLKIVNAESSKPSAGGCQAARRSWNRASVN